MSLSVTHFAKSTERRLWEVLSRFQKRNSISIDYIVLPITSSVFPKTFSKGLFSRGKEWHVIYSKKWSLSHEKKTSYAEWQHILSWRKIDICFLFYLIVALWTTVFWHLLVFLYCQTSINVKINQHFFFHLYNHRYLILRKPLRLLV